MITTKIYIKFLLLVGYKKIRQKGSHSIFRNINGNIFSLPINKKEIKKGTFYRYLRVINLTKKDFNLKLGKNI